MTDLRQDWWPFYGRAFWTSERVLKLPAEAAALYLHLLHCQYESGSLPATRQELARFMPRMFQRRIARLWKFVEPFFPLQPDGRRANPQMQTVRNEQLLKSERLAEYGRRGAAAKWLGHTKRDAVANATAMPRSDPIRSDPPYAPPQAGGPGSAEGSGHPRRARRTTIAERLAATDPTRNGTHV